MEAQTAGKSFHNQKPGQFQKGILLVVHDEEGAKICERGSLR
jgi:hypothetical protein